MKQMNLQKQTHTLREEAYGGQEKGEEEGMVRKFGMDVYNAHCFI